MMHIANMHLSITPQGRGVATCQPLTHHGTRRPAAYKMHPQITMLRHDAVTFAQRHRRPHGRSLVSLRGIDTAHNSPLQKKGASAIFHSTSEAHKIVDL